MEIKCPIEGKNMTALAAAKTMKCFNLDCNCNIISFRDTHKYFNQIKLGMYLLNVQQCHFIVYADFDETIQVFEINFKEHFVQHFVQDLTITYFKFLLSNIEIKLSNNSNFDFSRGE